MQSPLSRLVAIAAFAVTITQPLSAAVVRLDATLNAAQETTASTSPAFGTATMWYDTATNTFTLDVDVKAFANTISGSHVHEAPVGEAGGVVTGLGDESAYTRDGNKRTATFTDLTYGGDPATLLGGGAYINLHSAEYPGGEIRGQFTARPLMLWAHLTPEQETAEVTSNAYGAAQMWFAPDTGKFQLILFVYNFTNTLANSHIHEAAFGVAGGVVNGLGAASAYNRNGNTYSQVWSDVDYAGDPVALLNGGAYINVHSDVYGPGEIRGQLWVSAPSTGSRLANVSSRGMAGSGDDSLVVGFVIEGTEPLQVIVTGRGPVLTEFGVAGALADPVLYVHDHAGNQLYWNDNKADASYLEPITDSGFLPTLDAEAVGILLLPPGPHTMTLQGAAGSTGIGLAEAYHIAD